MREGVYGWMWEGRVWVTFHGEDQREREGGDSVAQLSSGGIVRAYTGSQGEWEKRNESGKHRGQGHLGGQRGHECPWFGIANPGPEIAQGTG